MPAPAALLALHTTRELLLGRGLAVLAAWAVGNLVVSGYWLARTDRRLPAFFFHGMNVGWGAINTVLAAVGILGLQRHPVGLTLAETLRRQLFLENTFLFNAGLDVAYVATGFWLLARAAAPAADRPVQLLGYGPSLWVQGGFLLAFDALMWAVLHPFAAALLSLETV